jgi:uncharacterized protein YndB with AHSA1/START domain
VPTTRRARTIAADQQRVWQVIKDPHHMPRWWPGITRMERVDRDRFTQVYTSRRGRTIRLDFRVLASEAPSRRAWAQELAGSPLERTFSESVTEIVLEPAGEGTQVTIAQSQKLRGYSRTGGFLLRRATAKRLEEALDGLEAICA